MSVGLGLLKSLYTEGVEAFASLYDNGVTADAFSGDEGVLFTYIERFYLDYGSLPTVETVVATTGVAVDWSALPDEPLLYWIDRVKDRKALSDAAQHCDRLRTILAEGNIEEVRGAISHAYISMEESKNTHSIKLLSEVSSAVVEDHNKIQQDTKLPGVPFAFPFLNLVSGGMMGGDLISLVGRPGCLARETKIQFFVDGKIAKNLISIRNAYHKFNHTVQVWPDTTRIYWDKKSCIETYTLDENDKIVLGEVDGIVYGGQKRLFKVSIEGGYSIRTTKEHLFKVPEGTRSADNEGFKQLQDLDVGDFVMYKPATRGRGISIKERKAGILEKKEAQVRGQKARVYEAKYHPHVFTYMNYGKPQYYIYYKRAVCEAHLNNISVKDFVHIIKRDPERAGALNYLPAGMCFLHKDHDFYNFDFKNIVAYTREEYVALPHRKGKKAYRIDYTLPGRILSIENEGVEHTYDIQMKAPYHNFVANNFVVHNSAKSYFLLNDALHAHTNGYQTMFFSMEMPLLQCGRRIVSLRSKVNYTRLRLGRVSYFGMERIIQEQEAMSSEIPFHLISGGMFGTVDKFYAQVKHYRPEIVFLDGAYLMRPAGGSNKGKGWERATNVLENLKHISLSENIPIVISYQFNRAAPGTLVGISTTDTVGQLSSIVLSTEHEEGDDLSNMRPIQYKVIKVLKGREGETGKIRVELDFGSMVFKQDEVIAGVADDFEYEEMEERNDQNLVEEEPFAQI